MRPSTESRISTSFFRIALCCAAFVFCGARASAGNYLLGRVGGPGDEFDVFDDVLFVYEPPLPAVDGQIVDGWVDWEQDRTRVRVYLTWHDDIRATFDWDRIEHGKTGWAALLPVNHAGTARYSWTFVDSNGAEHVYGVDDKKRKTESYTITENHEYDDKRGMGALRFPDFNAWQKNDDTGTMNDYWWASPVRSISISSRPQSIRLVPKDPYSDEGGFIQISEEYSDTEFDENFYPIVKENFNIGSIWFKAYTGASHGSPGTLVLEKGYFDWTAGEYQEGAYIWTPIAEVTVPTSSGTEWYEFHLICQTDDKPVFRLRNATEGASSSDGYIDLIDLVLTPLIPDVTIVKDEMDYAPGFPSIADPVTFHMSVSNLYAGAPAQFVTPRLVWRQGEDDPWKEAMMTNKLGRDVQTAGDYACVLYADAEDENYRISDGPFEYFYEVSFTGYTPTFPAIRYPGFALFNNVANGAWHEEHGAHKYLIETNEWALLTDSGGTNSECRSPVVYPDFLKRATDFAHEGSDFYTDYAIGRDVVPGSAADWTNSGSRWGYTHRFDLHALYGGWPWTESFYYERPESQRIEYNLRTNMIPADFPFLSFLAKDGVRRFRSRYTDLAAVTQPWTNAIPAGVEPAYGMQHVGDYTWQAIIHVTNLVEALFSVTGACYAAEGDTAYDDGPFEWLEIGQEKENINPPMSGALEEVVNPETGVVTTNHHELIRFDTVPAERHRTETNVVTTYTVDPVAETGIFVGIVTNALFYSPDYTNEQGQAIQPTDADVAYWFEHLTETNVWEYDVDETTWEIIGSNEVLRVESEDVLENWNETEPGSGVWLKTTYDQFNNARPPNYGINSGNRVCVTNRNKTVYTSAVVTEHSDTNEQDVVYWIREPVIDPALTNGNGMIRTHVQIDYDGFLMFRFCTTNGSYQIRRAAWQDFNTWQADDRYYWRSSGLYDMKEFRSDLEGRDLTEFATPLWTDYIDRLARADVATRAAGETRDDWWSSSRGDYWEGLYGVNAQFFVERLDADTSTKKMRDKNGAILLDTYPGHEGSVETSRTFSGQGRDTLTMRVRSFAEDDRCITHVPTPLTASNYRVVARIRNGNSDQISDGEPSLSLIGYWHDVENYWEARIVQKTQMKDATDTTSASDVNWFEIHVYRVVGGNAYEVPYQGGRLDNNNVKGDSYNTSDKRRATIPGWNNDQNSGAQNNYGWTGADAEKGLLCNRTKDGGWAFAFDLYTSPDGKTVQPYVYAFLQGGSETSLDANIGTNTLSKAIRYRCPAVRVDDSIGGTTAGRPGYNTRDCGLQIAPYVYNLNATDAELPKLKAWNPSAATAWQSVPKSPDTDWDHNNTLYDRKQKIDVWQVEEGPASQGNPTRISRRPPTTWYRVEVFRSEREVSTNATRALASGSVDADWNRNWDSYHETTTGRMDGFQCASSWRWQPVEIPMNFWDDTFINIQAYSENPDAALPADRKSLAMLAVDTIACSDWRGQTVADPRNSDEETGWRATYAAIAEDGVHGEQRRYELNRSRANPNQNSYAARQGVSTPLLEKGVGDITFTYTVENHPVKIQVGILDSYNNWITKEEWSEILPVTEKAAPYYVYVATNLTGRIRIVTDDPSSACRTNGQLGTLYVDNLKATDYPAAGSTSWEVYNALVSTFPSNVSQRANLPPGELRKAKFDGVSAAVRNYRSAVLNDHETQGTINGTRLGEHRPFLQTPVIETGIGEVSFWYRASDDNGDTEANPGKIRLMASVSPNAPDDMWVPLTITNLYEDVSENPEYPRQKAEMEALTNITTKTWTYFNVEFFEKDYRVLRIEIDDNVELGTDKSRVMLDNVLITEPVRASIDVGEFAFVPDIPVNTKDTHARVSLVNPRMNPTDIHVWLQWYAAPGAISNAEVRTVSYVDHSDSVSGPFYQPVTLPDGRVVQAEYFIPTPWTEEIESVEETRYPTLLGEAPATRPWGYETWSNRWTDAVAANGRTFAGEIAMTNVPNTSVYLTSEPIPTLGMEPDSVIQYCVKVDYRGRFHEPVYSELQGETKNGYRFSNPSWYSPIDLNIPMGTTNKPVSYVFLFSCTTNTAFINEFKPATASNGAETFIEIMGPAGASVANWKLEHFGKVSGVLSPKKVSYTNVVEEGATFQPAWNAIDPTAVNKGWGFWVLGNYKAQQTLPELAKAHNPQANLYVQELFPPDLADNASTIITVPGALRLRRSMGAYVDKIAWGLQARVADFIDESEGFQWAGNLTQGTRSIAKDDLEGNWSTTPDFTPGGYNADEEEALPDLGGAVLPPPRVPALLDTPEITEFEFEDDDLVRIRFRVRITDDSVADGLDVEEEDYEWRVLVATDVEDLDIAPGDVPMTDYVDLTDDKGAEFVPIPSADGTWTWFDAYVPANNTRTFYRVYARPKQ